MLARYLLVSLCFLLFIKLDAQDTISCPIELELPQPGILSSAKAFDFNLDGKLEQVSFNGNSDKIYLKRLEGSVSTISTIDDHWATSIDIGFLNKDKYPDLIICNDHRISYMLGEGGFRAVRSLTTKKINGRSIQSAFILDIDNDYDGDILVHYDGLGLYLIENEDQNFDWQNMEKVFSNNYGGRGFGKTCDLNQDGWMDFVFYNPYAGAYALLNSQNKSFSAQRISGTWNPVGYTVGDINNDGFEDIVQGYEGQNANTTTLEVFINNQMGGFNRVESKKGFSWPGALSLVDLNGDSQKELIVGDQGKIFVFQFNADNKLILLQQLSPNNPSSNPDNRSFGMITCDRDRDGDLDFVVKTLSSLSATEFYSQCQGTYDRTCDPYMQDLDGDGYSFADCDDNDPEINIDAVEIVGNFVDENCDGEIQLIPDNFPISDIKSLKVLNNLGYPESLSKQVSTTGTIISQNFGGDDLWISVAEPDGEGIWAYNPLQTINVSVENGDSVLIYGTIIWKSGTTTLKLDGIVNFGKSIHYPNYQVTDEISHEHEGSLLKLMNLSLVDKSKWLSNGSSFNVEMTDGNKIYTIHINEFTDLASSAPPEGKLNLTGIGHQNAFNVPFDGSFRLIPRGMADIELVTSVKNNEQGKRLFVIHPTLTTDRVHISALNPNDEIKNIKLYNLNGQLLMNSLKPQKTLSLNNFEAGIYILRVQSSSGYHQVFKIVKTGN